MFKLFSVDDHIVEPAHTWVDRVPARFKDRAPRVIDYEGRQAWAFEDTIEPQLGLNAVAGKPRDQWGTEPTRFDDMIPGCYDPKARAADMRSNGIAASVNFPTLPGFGGRKFQLFQDKELALACVRAWNDFVIDEWCAAEPGMFVPMVITATWDVHLAVAEVERCLDKGAKALCWVEDPSFLGLPSYHTDHWDPLMALCQDADLPICMHIGSSGAQAGALNVSVVQIASAFVQAAACAVNLMCSPIPRKFPDIKFVWSEGGIGWIPAAIERADRQWERHKYWSKMDNVLPSEICHRNMWFCMIEEPLGLGYRHDWNPGCDHILWESDYPHADTPWPDTQACVKELFEGVPADEAKRIMHGNAERLFHSTPTLPEGYTFE